MTIIIPPLWDQLQQYFIGTRMKPTLGSKNVKSKPPSMYQEYRSRTKSQLDCSELLSGISELDNQMSKYDQLRKQRLSQSFVIEPEEQFSNMRSSMRLEEKTAFEVEQTADDNLLYAPLVPILEYQKVKPIKLAPSGTTSKSMLDSKFNKEKTQTSAASMRLIEADAKLKQEKRQKVNALKMKTKLLQQQFLQAFSNDILKKSTINKQFTQLLKLLQ